MQYTSTKQSTHRPASAAAASSNASSSQTSASPSTTISANPSSQTPRFTSAYSPQIRIQLAQTHSLHLTPIGVDLCVGEILASERTGTVNRQVSADQILQHALNRSLEGIGARVLPSPLHQQSLVKTTLSQTAWLQIQRVRDISRPLAQQQSQAIQLQSNVTEKKQDKSSMPSATRMLQLELTDGVGTVLAIEYSPLPFTLQQLIPGRKILVQSGTAIANGILLLEKNQTGPIEGNVDTMSLAYAMEMNAENRSSRSNVNGSDIKAPPSFRPFAERHIAREEAQREKAIAEARRDQEMKAMAKSTPSKPDSMNLMKLMPAAEVEEAATGVKTTEPNPSKPTTTTAAGNPRESKFTRGHTQVELEQAYEAQEKQQEETEKAAAIAAANKKLAASKSSSAAASAAAATTPNVLSSFRTLLTAPLNTTHAFSARVLEAQLYPPRVAGGDFAFHLNLSDSFSLRVASIASTQLFEVFFGSQQQFAKLMKEPSGQNILQQRLIAVRKKLVESNQYFDVDIEIKSTTAAPAPGGAAAASSAAGRNFVVVAFGEFLRSQRSVPHKLKQPQVKEVSQQQLEEEAANIAAQNSRNNVQQQHQRTIHAPRPASGRKPPHAMARSLTLLSTFFVVSILTILSLLLPVTTHATRTRFTAANPFPQEEFMVGTSYRADMQLLDVINQLQPTHVRLYGHFKYVVPILSNIDPDLTVEAVQQNFAALATELNSQANWNLMDTYITSFFNGTTGVQPILELGEGSVQAVPQFNRTAFEIRSGRRSPSPTARNSQLHPMSQIVRQSLSHRMPKYLSARLDAASELPATDDDRDAASSPFDPNLVGHECYLAYMYLYSRIFLQRYTNPAIAGFSYEFVYFQLENELNEAFLASAGGVRYFQLFGSSWSNTTFMLTLLQTLKQAVLTEVPTAVVTTNLHTDVPESIHRVLNLTGYYGDAAEQWYTTLDWISFDSYPNMFFAGPLCISRIEEIISTIRAIVPSTMWVTVMETGYEALAPGTVASNISAEWTEANQVSYASQSFKTVVESGGNGFMWFSVAISTGMTLTFTQQDYDILTLIGELIASDGSWNSIVALLDWSLANLSYVMEDFGRIIHQVGQGWGTNRADKSARPVVQQLQTLFQQRP